MSGFHQFSPKLFQYIAPENCINTYQNGNIIYFAEVHSPVKHLYFHHFYIHLMNSHDHSEYEYQTWGEKARATETFFHSTSTRSYDVTSTLKLVKGRCFHALCPLGSK